MSKTKPTRGEPKTRVDWTRYAEVYDLMATCNPAYRELTGTIAEIIRELKIPTGGLLADIGAGTGEYSIALARTRQDCRVVHVEPNEFMAGHAQLKQERAGLLNLRFQVRKAHELLFDPGTLDLCLCVHALYTMPNPRETLSWFHTWLKPGATLVLCDLGRTLDVRDWREFIVAHLVRERGWLRAMTTLWRGRQVARQNKQIASQQRCGAYWTHSPEELRLAVESAGFEVLQQQLCYRGFSDLVVARRL